MSDADRERRDDSRMTSPAAEPLELRGVALRNRLVATAHASGLVQGGLPIAGDDAYWGRLAAGGAAMLIGGGTVTAAECSPRRGNIQEAWRPAIVDPWRRRVRAIHDEGGVAVVQLVHLGRETLGADSYWAPVAPSAVRSPREPTAPRALLEREVDALVDGFRVCSEHALEAGFDGIELHAAHAYLLEQFLSPRTNLRGDGLEVLQRVIAAIRELSGSVLLGIRFSADASEDVALRPEELADVLSIVDPLVDWVNLTVGVRTTYVRDMATERPPLLDDLARVRPLVNGPLIVSHAFREAAAIERALEGGADLVGMARALIADPDLPAKLTSGRAVEVRPCVACNEDCRTFEPMLLCTVNPDLKPPGEPHRPAAPLTLRWTDGAGGRVAVVGAGPAGLECALTLARSGVEDVVLFETAERIGGQLAIAADAPNRSGWAPLLRFYEANLARVELRLGQPAADLDGFDAVVLATGVEETSRLIQTGALASSAAIAAGPDVLAGAKHVVVVDDGFGWWPGVSAVELAHAAEARVTFLTPGTAFAAAIPAESRVQLLQRLTGELQILPLTSATAVGPEGVTVMERPAGRKRVISADRVIVVGERRPRPLPDVGAPVVVAIGDAIVPRRAAHAIAEGRAAGVRLAAMPRRRALQAI
jgi:2,4-dienoyl-CoA reductase-like NADH-dependent reductase (Old Yellow Enzyme family)/NADPH-dependent 2,4-dienoyl-CoA reductase/sulfur reductase-like enzyme